MLKISRKIREVYKERFRRLLVVADQTAEMFRHYVLSVPCSCTSGKVGAFVIYFEKTILGSPLPRLFYLESMALATYCHHLDARRSALFFSGTISMRRRVASILE